MNGHLPRPVEGHVAGVAKSNGKESKQVQEFITTEITSTNMHHEQQNGAQNQAVLPTRHGNSTGT